MNLGTPIAVGNTAQIFLYENKIVKVFNDYLPHTEATYEANKQKYADSCGLSVPKIIDARTEAPATGSSGKSYSRRLHTESGRRCTGNA